MREKSMKEILTKLCQTKNISLAQLSRETGIKIKRIYKLCEYNKYPSLENAIILCNYFNCSIDYLLELTDKPTKRGTYSINALHKNYAKLLEKKKTNNGKVSQELRLGKDRMSEWQRGAVPYVSTLINLAKYFKVSVEYLIREND